MASGKRPSHRKRPPPVIDLDATEVARGPISPEKPTDPAPDPTPEAVLQTPPPEPPREPPPDPSRAGPEPEPPRRPHVAWLPPDVAARLPAYFSSPMIGAGL